jgi:hypothetical protein
MQNNRKTLVDTARVDPTGVSHSGSTTKFPRCEIRGIVEVIRHGQVASPRC